MPHCLPLRLLICKTCHFSWFISMKSVCSFWFEEDGTIQNILKVQKTSQNEVTVEYVSSSYHRHHTSNQSIISWVICSKFFEHPVILDNIKITEAWPLRPHVSHQTALCLDLPPYIFNAKYQLPMWCKPAIFVKPQQWPTPSESIAIYCVRKVVSCVTHLQSCAKVDIWNKKKKLRTVAKIKPQGYKNCRLGVKICATAE